MKLNSALEHSRSPPDSYLWSAAGANYFLGRYEETLSLVHRMTDQNAGDRIAAAPPMRCSGRWTRRAPACAA